MKAIAVMLGPAGVGLVGLYMNLLQTASTVSAVGLGSAGTRQVATASANGGSVAVGKTRRALFWGTMVLALLGAMIFWMVSGWIAVYVFKEKITEREVRWLSLGVALSVAAGSQSALLTGLRRVGDLASVNVISAILSSAMGVAALWFWGERGLVPLVLAVPFVTFVIGHIYVARLGVPEGPFPSRQELYKEWAAMVTVGAAFMISGVVTMTGFLVARTLIQRQLGADALGQFQAAWAIGMTYLGFVLGAMGTDFYPRLSASINNSEKTTILVNQQTEVALLLCAPVLITMLGCAPYIIHLLYSNEFEPATQILRWQLLGDILKVMSWPLGYVLVAAAAGKNYVLAEVSGIAVYVIILIISIPHFGIVASGVSFLALYLIYLPLVWWLVRRYVDGFSWSKEVLSQAVIVAIAAAVVELAARKSDLIGAMAGVTLGSALGFRALMQLAQRTDTQGKLVRIVAFGGNIRNLMNRK